MSDSERSEIFAAIPRSQPSHASMAFILPDALSDAKGVAFRDLDRVAGQDYASRAKQEQAGKTGATGRMVS